MPKKKDTPQKADPSSLPENKPQKPAAPGNPQGGQPAPSPSQIKSMLEAQAEKYLDVDDDLPLSTHLILFSITLFFIVFVIWANFATLDEVTRGNGKIVPSSEVQALQSLEGGIVEEFMVREGDDVKAGQPLIRLRDIDAASDLGSNRARFLGIQAAISRLQAEAEGMTTPEFPKDVMENAPSSVAEEMNTFRANQANMNQQLSVLIQQKAQRQQEVAEIETRIRDTREVILLSQQEMEMIRPLVERGSAPQIELLQLERSLKERQSELNGLLGSLPRARSAVAEIDARIREAKGAFQAQAQTELASRLTEMNAIGETLSALQDRKKRTELRSPVDGTVKDIMVTTVGGVVRPGETVIEIVPHDEQLVVEAQIKPSDIAFIGIGQDAVIKVTAYDYSIYGGLNGEVIDISADTITDERGESFYRVRLQTEEKSLKRKNEVLPIKPGMVTSVDILTGEKTVMQYILKPFIKTIDNAMNER